MITGVELVKYLLKNYGPLPQKKLQKLAYMAEIEYIQKHGKRLSDLSFIKYYYGPYSLDITSIEDLEEDIIIKEEQSGSFAPKMSELVKGGDNNIDINPKVADELNNLLKPYINKNGSQLAKTADNTEPFLEAKNLKDPLDLDGYAWYYKTINSDQFWEKVKEKDEENKKNNVYGKHIIKDDSELDALFS